MTSILLLLAHPGQGDTEPESWTHYLTEPVHVIGLIAAVAIILVAVLGLRAMRQRDR
jgi:hypothetical protein